MTKSMDWPFPILSFPQLSFPVGPFGYHEVIFRDVYAVDSIFTDVDVYTIVELELYNELEELS